MASNKRLNALITIGGAVSGSLKSAIGTTKSGLSSIGSAIATVTARQKELNRIIADEARLGRGASALKVEYANRELATLDKRLAKLRSVHALEQRINAAQQNNLARRADLRGKIFDAVAIGATVSAPIVQAAQFEKAMLGVQKQVNGARDANGKLTAVYFEMRKQIQLLGREIPLATNDIALMVAAGARMGIAKDELIEFTRQAAMMSSAFDLPADELADNMGKIAALYKIPIPQIARLGDAINYLDDNTIAKGGDIIEFMQRVGGVASSVKIGANEMAALGSTLLTLGERTETASTATNAIFQKFAAATKGTKKFRSAMEELGLSLEETEKGMQKDAGGQLMKILEAIKAMPADKQLGIMTQLVGMEHSDTMAKLVNGTAEYRRELELLNDPKLNGSMQREFNATQATTLAQYQIMKNNVAELAVNIGSVLLPAVNGLFKAIAPVVQTMANFAQENPKLTQAIVGTAVAFGTLNLATLGVRYLLTFVAGGFLQLIGIAIRLTPALRMVGMAVMFISRALLLNPIGLAITAIATAAFLIYKNWEPLKAFFTALWADITATFQKSLDWIVEKIAWVGQQWQNTKAFFGFDSTPAPAVGATVSPARPMAPSRAGGMVPNVRPLPAIPSGRGAQGSWTDNSQTTIQVTQQPGQNTRQLAEEITKIQEQQRAARNRGRLTDGIGAQ